MENINYSQIYTKLTKGLSPKIKDIFDRRFGVKSPASAKPGKGQVISIETLESIGKDLGITRERVRQIEEAGFTNIRKNHKETLDGLLANLHAYFAGNGGFKKEETLMEELGGKKHKPYVLFLLTLGGFARVCDKKDNYNFWTTKNAPEKQVRQTLNALVTDIQSHGALLAKEELSAKFIANHGLQNEAVDSYLEISKKIQTNKEGKFGLVDWPEIKPRGVKDKAFLVFKQHKKPLHFRELTSLIDTLEANNAVKKTHAQTVHNELIKDSRFVLVGRGMYALAEWGYQPGTIKDVIARILKEKPQLTSQEEIVKEVLSQRVVAKNTVLINLNNRKYFNKDNDGKYFVRETQTA